MTAPRPLRALVGVGASLTLVGGLLLGGLPAQADETPAPTAPTATAPVVPADTTVTRTYPDGAAATMDVAWARGRTLHVSGTGFFAEDGKTPSTIAIKLTSGTDKLNNGAVTAQFQAQADGTFSVELPYPTIANGGAIRQGKADSSEELKIGEPVGVNLLTGSLQTGDRMRGGPIGYAAITAAPAPTEDPTPEPTTDPTTDPTGEPTPVPSTEPTCVMRVCSAAFAMPKSASLVVPVSLAISRLPRWRPSPARKSLVRSPAAWITPIAPRQSHELMCGSI